MWSQPIHGQPVAVRILTQAMAQRRLAHGYLFVGPEGVGKRLTALRLAQAINCEQGEGQACGVCPSCHKHAQGLHLDLHLVTPHGQRISVEQVKELSTEMVRRPHEGRYRVAIIDPADRLSPEATNALLKTLEEPAPASVFILISDNLEGILPTIRSRCQLIRFGPLPTPSLIKILGDRGVGGSQATVIARLARGSAQEALRMATSADWQEERAARLRTFAEVEDWDLVHRLKWAEEQDKIQSKEQLTDLLKLWQSWYRDRMVAGLGGTREQLQNPDIEGELRRLPYRSRQAIEIDIKRLGEAVMALERNAVPRLVLENVLLGLRR
ncbi:MAG: DNA polymerase III subunit delta' [Bacillota bacterium]